MKSQLALSCFAMLILVIPIQSAKSEDRRYLQWQSAYFDHSWKLDQKDGPVWMIRLQKDGSALVRCVNNGHDTRGVWKENSWGNMTIEDQAEDKFANVLLSFEMDCKSLSWVDAKSGNWGGGRPSDFTFPASASVTAAPAASMPSKPSPTPSIAIFAREFSKASNWATLPLSNAVPGAIRDEIATIRESLKSEAAKTPQASIQAYGYADLICRNLIFDLDDRDNTLQQNKQDAAGKLSDAWMTAWAAKSARYRAVLRANFDQFVAAVRQSEKPKLPVPADMIASINLPPVPAAAGTPASDFKADPNNPLNRGAYDRHPIWWSPWW